MTDHMNTKELVYSSDNKFSITHLFPYRYLIDFKDLLKVKFPKYFTGKFHPNFYQSFLPTKRK